MKRCSSIRAALLGIALSFAVAASSQVALAAVSVCHEPLSSRQVQSRSELEARKQALADWLDKARQIGPEYTRWQLAFDRAVECSRTEGGDYLCLAVGRPCTIRQVPPEPGTFKRLRRGS